MTSEEQYLDNQKHNMIYYDKQICSINMALRRLYCVTNPILKYKQTISLQNLYLDLFFKEYIYYDHPNEILTISFPPQCSIITNIKNINLIIWLMHECIGRAVIITFGFFTNRAIDSSCMFHLIV